MDLFRDLFERNDFFYETLDEHDNTCLHIILSLDTIRIDLVQFLLEKGLGVNVRNKFGYSPLQIAVSNPDCNVDVVKVLLDRGADVNHIDDFGNSILHHLLRKSDCAVITLLIDKGADVNIVNKEGEAPLHYAVNRSSFVNYGMLPSLIEYKGSEEKLMASKLDLLKLLLERGPDINFKNNFGDSPLHFAVSNSNGTRDDLIRLLLRRGADLNLTNNSGESSLHCAFSVGGISSEVFELLLDHGANINVMNNYGDYPLCLAVKNPSLPLDTLKMLLDRGANVLACNKSGDLPLQKAIQDYDCDETAVEKVKLLIKYTLATSLGFNLNVLIKNTKHYQSLSKFATDCTLELIAMGSEKVAHVKYPEYQQSVVVTLYEFMCGYQALHPLLFDNQGRLLKRVVKSNINDVLRILTGMKFPLYNEVISAKVERKDMIDKLTKQLMFAVRGDDMIVLDFYSSCGVAKYLSNADLLNWIMAYRGALNPFFLISGVPVCKKLLGKRGGQEIERCFKRYKKTKPDVDVAPNLDKKPKIVNE